MTGFLPNELARMLSQTPELSQAFLVGGCVRDWLLGIPCKDFDIEVFGLSYAALELALGRWGQADLVGRSFGVMKLRVPSGATFDFSLPRRDSKVAPGHQGFEVDFDPALTPRQAAARRDFTLNALAYDPRRDELLDFFGGEADLRNRVLRHVSEAFVEDPLRVLRGMQLAARFDLRAAPETIALCRLINSRFGELASERVREEWFKWAARATAPSAGLKFLLETEWLEHFPELNALVHTPQDPEWHPEGGVFTHTCHCLDALVNLPEWRAADENSRIVLALAVLTHDFGKPATTQEVLRDGRRCIVSPGHEATGLPQVESFLHRLATPLAMRERVLPLVANHMIHLQPHTDRSLRRLARRLAPESIASLCVVMTADSLGRPPKPQVAPAGIRELLVRAGELDLQTSAPKPILLGRHLIARGYEPGPALGEILNAAFEAQLEGAFADLEGALRWLEEQPPKGGSVGA